ncbi:MAG: hypothetical protein KDA42_10010, partial [Planctomycetales bacterium]|nr:hypothetical protein [Planctomycetales bacterium]
MPPSRSLFPRVNIEAHTAPVRALAFTRDSQHLLSAGMDKVVHVWRLSDRGHAQEEPADEQSPREAHGWERTIRWELERGLRGSIHAIASSPEGDRVAIGGYGHRGSLGEIVWVNPHDGTFTKSEYDGHRQSIAALAYSSDGAWLASSDTSGRLLTRSAEGKPTELRPSDGQQTGLRPLAMRGARLLVAPEFAGQAAKNGTAIWKLRHYQLPELNDEGRGSEKVVDASRQIEQSHFGMVTALAASNDGRFLASADLARRLYLWDRENDDAPIVLSDQSIVLSLAFSPDGASLLAGTGADATTGQGELQVWDPTTTAQRRATKVRGPVLACAVSPNGERIAYVSGQGRDVVVEPLAGTGDTSVIRGGSGIAALAFDGADNGYRISFALSDGTGQKQATAGSFDPILLTRTAGRKPVEAPEEVESPDGWNAEFDRRRNRLQLKQKDLLRGFIQVDRARQGSVQTYCWVLNEQ